MHFPSCWELAQTHTMEDPAVCLGFAAVGSWAAHGRVDRVDGSHCSSMHIPIVLGELVAEFIWGPASSVVHISQNW